MNLTHNLSIPLKTILSFALLVFFSINISSAQNLKPYTIGEKLDMDMSQAKSYVSGILTDNGFEVLGDYKVANDDNRYLYAVTTPELRSIVELLGAKRGYLSVLRVAITTENGKAIVSYTTPQYWAYAYLQKSYVKVSSKVDALTNRFSKAFSMNTPYGAKEGHSIKDLQAYHYMFGMPYFNDDVELGTFSDFNSAVQSIDSNLDASTSLKKVYEISFANKEIKLYGIGLNTESSVLSIIDGGTPKHTGFLPYELLVYKNKAYMLHGRFRIALSFPDLTMGTFMKIMSTPGDIEKSFKSVCR